MIKFRIFNKNGQKQGFDSALFLTALNINAHYCNYMKDNNSDIENSFKLYVRPVKIEQIRKELQNILESGFEIKEIK